jgi:hypothetical protein
MRFVPRPSPHTRPILRAGTIALVALAAALALRHFAIEPASIAHACDPEPWRGACAARSMLMRTFLNQELGWLAFGAGVLATVMRGRAFATFALGAGAAGLVLYSYEPAAAGGLLGLLVLARASAQAPSKAISNA